MLEGAILSPSVDGHLFEYCDPSLWLSVVDAYQCQGISTVPIVGKSPVMSNYQKRSKSYGPEAFDYIAKKHPDASCGILMEQNGLCVVDLDIAEPDFLMEALDAFGWTDIIISTPRGYHLYYKSRPDLHQHSTKDIDLKAGRAGFVVAPGTVRDGIAYRLSAPAYQHLNDSERMQVFVDLIKSRNLPVINMEAVESTFKVKTKSIEKIAKVPVQKQVRNRVEADVSNIVSFTGRVHEGGRNNFLVRTALRYARECQGNMLEALQLVQHTNAQRCNPPLDDKRIVGITAWACEIEREGKNRIDNRGKKKPTRDAKISPDALAALIGKPRWEKALALYLALQQYNMPNDVFVLAPRFVNENIGRKNPDDRNSHAAIKKTLIDTGLIMQVGDPVKGKCLARYAFKERAEQLLSSSSSCPRMESHAPRTFGEVAYRILNTSPALKGDGGAYNIGNDFNTHTGELKSTLSNQALLSDEKPLDVGESDSLEKALRDMKVSLLRGEATQ